MRNTRFRLGEDRAEAVLQENLQPNILLTDEPALRQLPAREQIEHGADRCRGRDLNGARSPTVHITAVDLVRIGFLDDLPVVAAADGDKDDHHVLQRGWYRM